MIAGAMLAVGAPPLVEEFAITVAAAAVFGYLAQRVGLVSIVGFLAAGVVIGPNALGWIDDIELVEQMGEIGVIFLMFFIGLELSGEMLKKMGALLFGGGALQVGLTIGLVTVIGGSQVFIAVTVVLITLTPLLFTVGRRVQHSLEGDSTDAQSAATSP